VNQLLIVVDAAFISKTHFRHATTLSNFVV